MDDNLKAELDAHLEAEVPKMIAGHLALPATQAQVAKAVNAVVARIDESNDDPYRTTIHFLAGLLTFCLGVIAAVFSALNSGNADPHLLGYKMLGGVLGSIAFVAGLCTVAAAIIQVMKFMHRHGHNSIWTWPVIWRGGLMLALALLGGLAVAYCVRYGYAILTCLSEPVGLWDSLMGLICLAF
jgi:hypothetical protein